jgi:hypothetical protein
MKETLETQSEFTTSIPEDIPKAIAKITILEALANEIPSMSINRSNYSSRQGNADYDDQ